MVTVLSMKTAMAERKYRTVRIVKKLVFISVIAILTTSIPAFSQPLHSGYMSIAAMGMGGAFTTYSRDATITLTNPALLNRTEFHLTIISVPVSFGDEIGDLLNFYENYGDSLKNLDNLTESYQRQMFKEIEPMDDQWVNLGANPFFGFTFSDIKFGLAVYSNLVAAVKIDQGVIVPAAGLKGHLDTGISFGKGFPVMDWESGLAMRFYRRSSLSQKRVSSGDMSSMDDITKEWENELTDSKAGFGLDAGVIRTMSEKMDIAVTVQDLVGSRDGWIKPNLITGVLYRYAEHLVLCADMNDWFNTQGVAFFQKLNMGAEYRLPFYKQQLGGIDFRAGIHQGYPTFGFGLRLLIINLDYAYFGMEGGNKPGQIMEYSHRLGISLTFN